MTKPNLFIIGASKCGTTSLAAYLAEHPEIFISTPKEIHYFSNPTYSLAKYEKIFRNAGPQHKVVGEASTSYIYFKQAVPTILEYNSNAKIIVMLRNPIDRLHSAFYEGLKTGRHRISDIRKLWRLRAETIEDDPEFLTRPSLIVPKDNFKLGAQVERLYTVAPDRSKILTILFEDLMADTKNVYENVLNFLNVSSDNRTHFPKFNQGRIARFPLLSYSFGLVNHTIRKAFHIKPHTSLTKGLGSRILIALSDAKAKRPPLPEDFRAELLAYFQEDIQKLSNLINRDLSHWK